MDRNYYHTDLSGVYGNSTIEIVKICGAIPFVSSNNYGQTKINCRASDPKFYRVCLHVVRNGKFDPKSSVSVLFFFSFPHSLSLSLVLRD